MEEKKLSLSGTADYFRSAEKLNLSELRWLVIFVLMLAKPLSENNQRFSLAKVVVVVVVVVLYSPNTNRYITDTRKTNNSIKH